jgi:alpha-L-rhamnosidase
LEAEFRSPAGTYKSAWAVLDEEHIELRFTIPFGCTAELVLPFAPHDVYADSKNPMFVYVKEGICHLSAGEYYVTYKATEKLKHTLSTNNTVEELMQNSKAKEVLKRKLPQIEEIPSFMQKSSLRQLMEQYDNSSLAGLLQQLDLELAALL